MGIEYNPMRSLIYVDVVKEDYRHKLLNWLYQTHVPDSISQFGPYVTKYAFYNALPTPPDGERFGTVKFQLTEHYWTINPMQKLLSNKALTEVMPAEILVWQGNMPEDADLGNLDGDAARASGGNNGCQPFIFAFVPVWWELDIKGKKRTINDGPNYRWNFVISYPEGVSMEVGDKWLFEEVIPVFEKKLECTRILSSKVIKEVNGCPMDRMVEMWFDCPSDWHKCIDEATNTVKKPDWAQEDLFPYLKPLFNIKGCFVTDNATSDNFSQYRGYVTMR